METSIQNENQPDAGDPLLAPPSSMPESPLLRDEGALLRPSLLDFNPTTRRMENLDALRIVAMTSIILVHVLGPFNDVTLHRLRDPHASAPLLFLFTFAISVASRIGVPCFMMISFYIYWHQLYDKNRTWPELLKRRFKRLFPAFFCWSMVYLGVHRIGMWLIAHHIASNNGNTSFSNHFRYIDLKQWQTWIDVLVFGQAEYHLYYLSVVMQCLLLIPLLRLLWKKPTLSWGWVILTVAGWSIAAYGLALAPVQSALHRAIDVLVSQQPTFGGMTANQPHPWYRGIFNEETALPLLVFPLLGMMCAGQKPFRKFIAHSPTKFWIALLIVGLAMNVGESFLILHLLPGDLYDGLSYMKAGRLISGLAVFVLFLRHPLMRDPLPHLSHYAFGMHFMHPMIIVALSILEQRCLANQIGNYEHHILATLIINFVLTYAITFTLCLLIGSVKRLQFLVV